MLQQAGSVVFLVQPCISKTSHSLAFSETLQQPFSQQPGGSQMCPPHPFFWRSPQAGFHFGEGQAHSLQVLQADRTGLSNALYGRRNRKMACFADSRLLGNHIFIELLQDESRGCCLL